tara:strand:- start:3124 stop:5313 length:2190 start_codon:yes stop_codon:yes gene_type:complete
MMSILYTILILFSFIFTKDYYGYVIDIESGNPIKNVTFSKLNNNEIITQSNVDGYYLISDNQVDFIELKHIGYKNKILTPSQLMNKIYLEKDILYGDMVEITSSRKETRISDSPMLTHIISSKELESSSALDFYQAIQMIIPNVMFAPDYHGTNLKIQGLDSEYVLILIDGDRIAGNTVGNIDFSKFNIDEIERIEILKGNASTLYGSNAIGGVINIITKPTYKNNMIKFRSSYGKFNTLNNSATLNVNIPFKSYNIASKTNILFKGSDGYKFSIPDTLRKRKYEDYNISQSLKYKNEDLSIELLGDYYNHNWYRFMTSIPYTQPERNHRKQYESYSIKLKEKNHLTRINGHYNFSYTFDKYIKYHVIDNNYNSSNDDMLYDWTNHSVQQISSILYLFKNKFNFTLGVDALNESGESNDIIVENTLGQLDTLLLSELGNLYSKSFQTNALFMQSEYTPNKFINLFLGVRYTNHNQFEDQLTSQFTFKYSLNDNHFRFNIGQGYRVPNIYELYYNWNHYDGFDIIGNENLKPEKSLNISTSYQKLLDDFNFMILFQRNMINNMIAELRNENGDFLYENYDKTSINSIESNLGFKFNQFNLELSYNYTNITDEIDYKRLPNISEHMININLFYELYDLKLISYNLPKMKLTSNINYYSDKILIAPTSGQETYIPDFYQVNISSVFQDIPYKNIDLKFGINNLLDYTNFDDKTFQSPGLTYKMEIFYKYEFK